MRRGLDQTNTEAGARKPRAARTIRVRGGTLAQQPIPWLKIGLLTALAVGVLLLWSHPVLLPVRLLVVLFHELGHALAAWATGGEVIQLAVNMNEGGHVLSRGGWPIVILNAGYLGSLAAGVGALAAARSGFASRVVVGALGVLLAFVLIFYVPLLSFGFLFVGATCALMLAGAALVPGFVLAWTLRALGVFSVLYALHDVIDDVFARVGAAGPPSDASLLAELTGVPALVWGLAWLVGGVALLAVTRRWWI